MKILHAVIVIAAALSFAGCSYTPETAIRKAKESGARKLTLDWAFKVNWGLQKDTDLSPLEGMTHLRELRIQGHCIADLTSLSSLPRLNDLRISGNKVTDLTPLKGLTELNELHLSGNNITDITPLKGLIKLRFLQIQSERLSDVTPLKGLTQLESLKLYNHKAPSDQIEMLRKALPNCKIKSRPIPTWLPGKILPEVYQTIPKL